MKNFNVAQSHFISTVAFTILNLILALPSANATTRQQSHIMGFRYQSCFGERCIEVQAAEASLSQLRFGFTTLGETQIIIRGKDGRIVAQTHGHSATLHSDLNLITVDTDKSQEFTTVDLSKLPLSISGGGL